MFSLQFNARSYKALKKYPQHTSKRLLEKIKKLTTEPIPHDAKRIINEKGKMFRVRVGLYRILYVINYEKKEIYIANIDTRARVY
jgi:mRNA interferase RelE/StbE